MIVSRREIDFKPNGFVGIDPGSQGAVAIWRDNRVFLVYDMPCHDILVNGKKRNVVDYLSLADLLVPFIKQNFLFTVETTPVFAIGKGSNSSANWSLGYAQGFLTGFFVVHKAAFNFVRTQEWHKLYDYKGIDYSSVETFKNPTHQTNERKRLTKLHSLTVASSLAPHIELRRNGKKFKTGRECAEKIFDGRCEAIIIADYGRSTNVAK